MTFKVLLVLAFLCSALHGHNNAFLPGDAFFATALTEEEISKFEKEKPEVLELGHQRLDNDFAACGHVGYFDLQITDLDEGFRSNFLRAYREVREKDEAFFVKTEREGQEELFEWNPVVALVYNKGKVAFPLGVKFNEDWKKQGHGKYGGILDDAWSVLQDWKRGADVPPLELEEKLEPYLHLEPIKRRQIPRGMNQKLRLKAANAEIVFVGILKKNAWVLNECPNLKELAKLSNYRSSEPYPRYVYRIHVTSESARCWEFGDDGWEESMIDEDGILVPVKSKNPDEAEAAEEDGGDQESERK